MNIAGTLSRPLYWLAGKIFSIWARPAVQPDDPRGMLDPAAGEIVYVLETGGLADLLALERVCARKGLPSPTESFDYGGIRENRRVVVLRHKQGIFARRAAGRSSPRLRRLVDASLTTGDPLQLVPVAGLLGPPRELPPGWLRPAGFRGAGNQAFFSPGIQR